ncbi:MAG: host-nuclease inhibitor Gam family protein [Azoarcus sp.]|nr:host-nuclease inhibitor Gam family protein [Azoarcus sp.]
MPDSAYISGIQLWCEAHRAELTTTGGKTTNLVTGEVSWRQRPPSVSVRQQEKVHRNAESSAPCPFPARENRNQ